MKGINKMGGLARGCEPDGTADELPKKEGEAAKPEPPGEVIAEALKLLRADRRGRWHVRAPEIARHREGLYAWAISDSEVKRLLRLLWPSYVASRQRLADRLYGGDAGRVSTSWRSVDQARSPRGGGGHCGQQITDNATVRERRVLYKASLRPSQPPAGQTHLRSLASNHEVRARHPASFFLRLHLLTHAPHVQFIGCCLSESQFDSIFGKSQGVGAGDVR